VICFKFILHTSTNFKPFYKIYLATDILSNLSVNDGVAYVSLCTSNTLPSHFHCQARVS